MTTEIFLRYLHFLSIIIIAGTLCAELMMLRPQLSRKELSRIAIVDGIYGLAAVVLISAGLTLWLGSFTKPAVYYSRNWVFMTKLTLVAIVALLSVYPTIFYLRQRKGNPDDTISIPRAVINSVRLEVLLLTVIPLLAGLMARGVGMMR